MTKFCTYLSLASMLLCLGSNANGQELHRHYARNKVPTEAQYKKKLGNYTLTFFIDNKAYFCDEGTYYRQVGDKGYEQIETPKDVVVTDLPYGARKTYVNGYTYYNADGMWFHPIGNVFLIVDKPGAYATRIDTLPEKTYQATFGF